MRLTLLLLLLYTGAVNGQFGPHQSISNRACFIEETQLGDIDNDGFMDIIVLSVGYQQILWFRNDGTGGFDEYFKIGDVDVARRMSVVDINLDGLLDVLTFEDAVIDKLIWYENLGGGEFGPRITIADDISYPTDVDAIDLNGDGDLDIISTDWYGTILWYENLGGEIFADFVEIDDDDLFPNFISGGDLDGDSDNDLVIAFRDHNKIAWYENDGTGSFEAPIELNWEADIGTFKSFVQVVDLDSDLDADIVATSSLGQQIFWYENLGGGSFAPSVLLLDDVHVNNVELVDFDLDGDLDLFSTSNFEFGWQENLGGGLFGELQLIEVFGYGSPTDAVIGQIDGDGDMDIVLSVYATHELFWYENLGGEILADKTEITTSALDAGYVYADDLDGDGDMDVLSASRTDDKIAYYINEGGEFSHQKLLTNGLSQAKNVLTADFNNDGKMDVIGAGNAIFVFYNLGGGVFDIEDTLAWGGVYNVYPEDLNGDGFVDIISTTNDNEIVWYQNNGDGTFISPALISTEVDGPNMVYAEDMDADGDMDVLSSSYLDDKIAWYENLGDGTFGDQIVVASWINGATSVFAADINGDGAMDVLSSSRTDDRVIYHEKVGDAFVPYFIASDVDMPYSVLAKDLDTDGDLDIVFAAYQEYALIWVENNGDGTFEPHEEILQATQPTSVYCADLDGDGDPEILHSLEFLSSVGYLENYFLKSTLAEGHTFIDINENGFLDSLDIGFDNIQITFDPESDFTYSDDDGAFSILFSDTVGAYYIMPEALENWSIVTDSLNYLIQVELGDALHYDSLNFGYLPETLIHELEVELDGAFPRCNTIVNYWISLENIGTTLPSGKIKLTLDDDIAYSSSPHTPDSIVGQSVYWHYDSLMYFSDQSINLQVLMPDFLSMGDTLVSYVESTVDSAGIEVLSITDTLSQILLCA
jgi:hypothetical protein